MSVPAAIRNAWLEGHYLDTDYLALFITMPNNEGVGGVEVSGGAYARMLLDNLAAAASGNKTNATDIEFVESTAIWGNVKGYGVYSALTGGTFKGRSDTFVAKDVGSGEVVRFQAGELDLNIN